MKRTKKHKIDVGRLDTDQVRFITTKVVQLGSVEAVDSYYRKGDTVGFYARQVARSIFSGWEED